MNEEENDGDPRLHLPKGMPILTPERMRKGDVRLTESADRGGLEIRVDTTTLLDWMLQDGMIEHEIMRSAKSYQRWRARFLANNFGLRLPFESQEGWEQDTNLPDWVVEYYYRRTLQLLGRQNAILVHYSLDMSDRAAQHCGLTSKTNQIRQRYRGALIALNETIARVIQERDAIIRNAEKV